MNIALDKESALNYLGLAEQALAERQGPQSATWLNRLEADYDNLLAALHWFVENRTAEEAQRLAVALVWFWGASGRSSEGRRWLTKVLAVPGAPPTARAKTLYEAGLFAFRQGDNSSSKSLNEESLSIARQLNDKRSIIAALVGLARASLRDLDFVFVRAYSEEGLAIAHELEDKKATVMPLHILAELTRLEGDYERARELYDQSLALNRELGNHGMIAIEHHNKGYVALHQNDFREATVLFTESMRLNRALVNQLQMTNCLAGLAAVSAAQGQSQRAARLFGAAETQLEKLGVILDPADRPEFDSYFDIARGGLDEMAFTAARAEGRSMTFEQAVEYALQDK